MSRAHFYRTAADDQGNVVPGMMVTIYEPGSLALTQAALYVNSVGSAEVSNPFTTDDGVIDFYMDQPGQMKIGLRAPNGSERFFDYLDVYPDPETVVQAPSGLQITNIPHPGNFLQATAPGQATWVSAPELQTAALTPLQVLRQQIFSSQSLGDLTLRAGDGSSVTPTFTNVIADAKPDGFSFTHALDWNTSQEMILTVPTVLFVESGQIQFLYKTIAPAAGETPGALRVTVDGTSLWVQTPMESEDNGVWGIGYLTNIPPGSHAIRLHHLPGSDANSRTLLGSLVVQYGGAVPPHDHEGSGILSTSIGMEASANYAGATALGGHAVVGGDSGTAVGAESTAHAAGTAVGASTTAVDRAVAVGYQARTSSSALEAVALGYNANAQGLGSIAVGPSAVTTAPYGVALGSSSTAAVDAVAVGRAAAATATHAVAIGAEATAAHSHAVALGPGAQTTAANQVVLGTTADTTVISGTLRQDGDAILGSADSTVAFFGEAGTTRPTVTGSRGGNAVLTTLISYLADLGLIIDNTTT